MTQVSGDLCVATLGFCRGDSGFGVGPRMDGGAAGTLAAVMGKGCYGPSVTPWELEVCVTA